MNSACGQHSQGSRECTRCEEKAINIQTQSKTDKLPDIAPTIVNEVISHPGGALAAAIRTLFEPKYGKELGAVHLHRDAKIIVSEKRKRQ